MNLRKRSPAEPGRLVAAGLVAGMLTLLALGVGGCAIFGSGHTREPGHVTMESRRSPVAADSARAVVKPATTAPRRESLLAQTVRDTIAAGQRLRRCAGRRLLPDQESLWDSTARLLSETRAALAAGDVARARSLARDARQLSSSLICR